VKAFVRALSPRAEFALVLIGAFGIFLPSNLMAFLSGAWASRRSPIIDNAHLQQVLIVELGILILGVLFLRARDWNLERIGLRPSVRDSLVGVGLNIASYLGYAALFLLMVNLWPAIVHPVSATNLVAKGIDLPLILAVSLVNPLFEEGFLCGYVMTVLKARRGVLTAINVSVAIRLFYHLYQGPLGVLSITPLGLIFAYWYARTGRLWPLVVAHSLADLVGFLAYTSAFK
jgi:membrane protease YdiL (CAAX protease family)